MERWWDSAYYLILIGMLPFRVSAGGCDGKS
jgi:hypothetical protein